MKIRENERDVALGARNLSIVIRRDPRARKIILRIDPISQRVILTLPIFLDEGQGLLFLEKKANWIFKKIDSLPPKILLGEGTIIPFLDVNHFVQHDPGQNGVVVKRDGYITINGRIEHLPRRLKDWLYQEAKNIIQPKVSRMALDLNNKAGRITIKDTKSRWGSCSPSGNLSFCWRLIMCPEWVIDYVVAHEVSHLRHMNHSEEFWRTVIDFNVSVKLARHWLQRNADRLQAFV